MESQVRAHQGGGDLGEANGKFTKWQQPESLEGQKPSQPADGWDWGIMYYASTVMLRIPHKLFWWLTPKVLVNLFREHAKANDPDRLPKASHSSYKHPKGLGRNGMSGIGKTNNYANDNGGHGRPIGAPNAYIDGLL